MFIYKRCFRFTLIFNKNNKIVSYLNKYSQSYNNLLSNLSISIKYLLVKSNFIQYIYYYNNLGSTLHLKMERLKIYKYLNKGKNGIFNTIL